MTFKEAAIQILSTFNKPMTTSEIWDEIEKLGLLDVKGKTPGSTLHTILLYGSDNSDSSFHYKDSTFTMTDKNPSKFTLIKKEYKDLTDEELVESDKNIPYYECVLDDIGNILKIYNIDGTLSYVKELCEDGFTYFIHNPITKQIKIGRENTLGDRFKTFKTSNPDIEPLFTIPHKDNESKYHKEFKELRDSGEWFFYAKGIKEFLRNEKFKKEDALKSYQLYLDSKKQEEEFLKHF